MNDTNEVWAPRAALDPEQGEHARRLGLSAAAGEVVARRAQGDLRPYLSALLNELPSPALLPDMDRAAERLATAITSAQRVTVFGDYDADGCTAAAVLTRFLREVGIEPLVRLPHRLKDGYGMNASMVEELAPGCDLLVTVDCGATCFEALDRAAELGIDVIVCDHHTVAERVPKALAVINPKRPESNYPPGEPAAVGVAWNLAVWTRHVLRQQGFFASREEPNVEALLALVALGTVADMVPLTGANRIFVRRGLPLLQSTAYTGLKVLTEAAKDAVLTERNIGFDFGPRLNAAGRLASADLAYGLLVSDDQAESRELFEQLDELNRQRRELQRSTRDQVMNRIRNLGQVPDVIVAYNPEWHPGVVGLAAGRLVERYHRPSIVIGMDGKGSARAPDGIHLVELLRTGSKELARFGGHAAAAGLTMAPEGSVSRLRSALNLAMRSMIGAQGHVRRRTWDAEVPPWAAHLDLALEFRHLAPFGMANPVPVLLARGLRVVERCDYKSEFTRIAVEAPLRSGRVWMDGFGMGRTADRGGRIDVLYELSVDFYRGEQRARRRVVAIREALTQ